MRTKCCRSGVLGEKVRKASTYAHLVKKLRGRKEFRLFRHVDQGDGDAISGRRERGCISTSRHRRANVKKVRHWRRGRHEDESRVAMNKQIIITLKAGKRITGRREGNIQGKKNQSVVVSSESE